MLTGWVGHDDRTAGVFLGGTIHDVAQVVGAGFSISPEAGETATLVKLIPRFYEPAAGEILLDGHPLQDYRLADLRRQIALVGQQVMLFDGSVAGNVAYGELREAGEDALADAVRAVHGLGLGRDLARVRSPWRRERRPHPLGPAKGLGRQRTGQAGARAEGL